MSNLKKEFRCTRNSPYLHDCFGRDDLGAREGYYIVAKDKETALRVMAKDFPKDIAGFTADFHKSVPSYTEEETP